MTRHCTGMHREVEGKCPKGCLTTSRGRAQRAAPTFTAYSTITCVLMINETAHTLSAQAHAIVLIHIFSPKVAQLNYSPKVTD